MANNFFFILIFLSVLFLSPSLYAQQQEEKQKTPEEIAAEQTNKIEIDLKLEPHQTFYVDSILSRNYRGLTDEIEQMKKSGAQEYVLYKQIQEKWTAKIDSALHKVLTEEQWYKYLKNQGKLKKEKKKDKKDKKKEKA